MEQVIGRRQEIEELNNLYESDKPEFVAIYGRRRVGKTFLVKALFHDRLTFYHSGLSPFDKERRVTLKDQLESFYSSLTSQGLPESHRPKSWMEAFRMLGELLELNDEGRRQVVFIDELPWLDTPRSRFLTALEWFWNTWASWHDKVMLIVCGSATSWMLDNLINNKGGLYDRLTWQIKLSPFTLKECKEYYQSHGLQFSDYDIVESYMVLGGIPYYMNYVKRGRSVPQNIDYLFFDRNAKLQDEFSRLFGSLFSNPQEYISVVKALAKRRSGHTSDEIMAATGIKHKGQMNKILNTLKASDFITSYYPFGNSKKEVRFKLTDNFCLFYLTFIDGQEITDKAFWQYSQNTSAFNAWRGITFEQVCFNHVDQIKAALGVQNVVSKESAWVIKGDEETKGAQIDMLISRNDRVVNLCEIKFLSGKFEPDNDDEIALRNRVAKLQEKISPKESIHLTLITTYGLKQNAHSSVFQNVVTMGQLFE